MACRCGSASRPSGEWNENDYDILADSTVVGRVLKVHTAPVGMPWMWTLAFGHLRGYRPRVAVTIGCAGDRFNLSPRCQTFRAPATSKDRQTENVGIVFVSLRQAPRRSKQNFRFG
jgi:hypothetical protein